MKTKLSSRFIFALTLFSLVGQIAWVVENMYLNVFIYKMFHASAEDISAMVAASAISATLTTVLIGALSDKLGKRKIFICSGYILWGISILGFMLLKEDWIKAVFPLAASASAIGVTCVIVLDCIMTFFGSSANDAAFNAWLTDSTDSTNRGTAEGINAMMPLVAILAVFGGFMFFDLNLASSWTYIFAIIGVVIIGVGIVGLFVIDEPKLEPKKDVYFKTVIHGFLPSTVRKNLSLYIYLLAFIIFNISIQIFMPYLILYYEVSLGMTGYVFIMAPAIVLASVVTVLWRMACGRLYRPLCLPIHTSRFHWLSADDVRLSRRHGSIRRKNSRPHPYRKIGTVPGRSNLFAGACSGCHRSVYRRAGSRRRGKDRKQRRYGILYSQSEHFPCGTDSHRSACNLSALAPK